MNRGLILTDCRESDKEIFLRELEEKTAITFENMFINTARWQNGLNNILRYLSYVFVPLYILIFAKQYDYIVSWQQFYGLFYAFWCNLFKLKKKKMLIIMTFIYKEKKGSIGKIYFRIMRKIVKSGYVDAFVCFSDMECQEYANIFGVDKYCFYPCRLSVDDCFDDFTKFIGQGDYYLAAGRSNRDYDFLCDAFEKFPDRKLIIICDKYRAKKHYNNIIIWNHTYGDEYFKCLAGCKAVIIPLNKDVEISSGQLVAIQGMMFGKVVVATENKQMKEYINHAVNGFLIPNTIHSLGEVLDNIETQDMTSMREFARQTYLSDFYKDHRSDIVSEIINAK